MNQDTCVCVCVWFFFCLAQKCLELLAGTGRQKRSFIIKPAFSVHPHLCMVGLEGCEAAGVMEGGLLDVQWLRAGTLYNQAA